jgi:uncharacterized protein YydD (DUF2326 family)
MIKSVRANKDSFSEVYFDDSFNTVLAERTKESTRKDSRNGVGKTTLLSIIHFCLGSRDTKGKGLRTPKLEDNGWTFFLDIILDDQFVTLRRETHDAGKIFIDEGDWSTWPIEPKEHSEKGYYYLRRDWTKVLGELMFDLPAATVKEESYTPTFRSLINYFARKRHDAFSSPFRHFRQQKTWDRQVNNAYLLNLTWEHAQRWQKIKDKEKTLDELKKAPRDLLPDLLGGSIGELEAVKVRLENEIEERKKQLTSFKVHPQYEDIYEEANSLTERIHKLVISNQKKEKLIDFYQSDYEQETTVSEEKVEKLYKEANFHFPDEVSKRLKEVQEFHSQIVENRRDFLSDQIKRLDRQISENKRQIEALSDEKADLMSILDSYGALEEFTELQERQNKQQTELETVKNRIGALRRFEKGKSSLRIEKEELLMEARSDYEERERTIGKAINIFNNNSKYLYNSPGELVIDITDTGFKYSVDIERAESSGFRKMKVFCYDLTLAELWSERERSPGFIIHDSSIFADVDERQIARALELAKAKAEENGFQYICLLNSDGIPYDELDFDIEDHVVLTLTDATESGSLLGMRF